MIYISDPRELKRIIGSNSIVLVAFVKEDSESQSISYAIRFFERIREPYMLVVIANIAKYPEIAEEFNINVSPTVRLYIDGKAVFEQQGGMSSYDKDVYALKEGIKAVLRAKGIRFLV